MVVTLSFEKKKLFYIICLILIFNFFFIFLFNTNFNSIKDFDQEIIDPVSLVHTSAINPPSIESTTVTKRTYPYPSYNFYVNMPSYCPDNDLYIAQIIMDDDASFSYAPPEWEEIENGYALKSGLDVRLATYWKIGNSEPSSYRWSCSSQRYWIGAIYRITGFDPDDPINASAISYDSSPVYVNPTAPSVTTVIDNSLILRMFGADDDNTAYPYWPSGTSPLFQDQCGYDTIMGGAAQYNQTTAGSTGSAQFTMSILDIWVAITIAIKPEPEYNPPTFSDLAESADPLELGDTETIRINATDESNIKEVLLEFGGSNHTMNNTIGDMWQYDSWTPTTVGAHPYIIWIKDNYNNVNFTSGSITVIDTTAPTYADLIESADPLQLGQNESISIKVFDSPGTGVNQVLLEYESTPQNHTMNYIGGNTWSWSNWKPTSEGTYSYKIYMQDMQDNWNATETCNITVNPGTAPTLENMTKIPDPLELGDYITINVDAKDTESDVDTVLIEFGSANYTMINTVGNRYEYNWTGGAVGVILFKIYANDTLTNFWNQITGSIDIIDTTSPTLDIPIESNNILELGNKETISINATDLSGINQAKIEFENYNHTMSPSGGDTWEYVLWTPTSTGVHFYKIYIEDNYNNWGFTIGNITVQDTTAPVFSNLTESANPVELGDLLTIQIIVDDVADIKSVKIEFEGSNHSMANIGGDIWHYDDWRPNIVGNYSYVIYMKDINNNCNVTIGSIIFQDTTYPTYKNLIENSDPLELGSPAIISLEISDFAGISQALIEFEGSNHSMNNIYGNVYQYNSWIPTNWTLYQYKIYMKDNSGNSNVTISNITVQDTLPPSTPIITNAPSGEVSGILTFDWDDGYDPSGISNYLLIIDNESDPYVTNGFVYDFNISNTGSESSFFEFAEPLADGRYYYFLYQVDGVGHQSGYTMGTFSIVSLIDPSLMNLIIIIVIIGSLIGVSLTIVIAKKKMKKEITPPREKIPLKVVISHIDRISKLNPTSGKTKVPKKKDRIENSSIKNQSIDEEILKNRIEKIRDFGKELFAEGAYLEAQKQYEFAEKVLLRLGREEEALKFSNLKISIKELTEEREKKLELLEEVKVGKNSIQIFELYNDLIEISLRLKDDDTAEMYKSELVQIFQTDKVKLKDLEYHRFKFYQKANSLLEDESFEKSAEIYGKCENISLFLIELGRINEAVNVEKFRYKINECLKKASQLNNNMR
ncbi:MAG: hypothetical protein P8Y23_02125 [Candidatus Lokiarchaeota archaeon]